MERKLRYKLHKVKKQWVTIAVASAGLASVVGAGAVSQTVSADEATNKVASSQAAEAQKEKQAVVTNDTNSAKASSEQVAGQTNPATSSEVAEDSAKSANQSADQKPAGQVAEQAAAQPAASQSKPASSANANLATSEPVSAQASTKVAAQSGLTEKEEKAALSLDKIQKIDGKYYYVMEDGSYKKNFAITVDGQVLYFDAKTGALSSTSTYSFSQGLTPVVSDFSINNRAYDSSRKSFELINGYLTADAWYRPAKVLQGGTTWVDSTEKDYRPILMSWWPDKDTQVAYLNYMSKFFGGKNEAFTTETSQVALNLAAKEFQIKIEQRITESKSTAWLRDAISAFVVTQDRWNSNSESYNKADHLQGGALLYTNSNLSPWANSKYRKLNRTPTYQTGETKYHLADKYGGYEFLLANDVDNSNPVVQAEMLNQIHYLMNWGSIVMGDKEANFDGIRVDAVDNVNADLLQLYTNYFNSVYGVNKSEAQALAHISVLEAWSYNDNDYNQDTNGAALAMDNGLRLSLLYSLTRPYSERSGMENLIKSEYGLTDRTKNDKYGDTQPSYVFVRAHDSEVQTVIAQIIREKIDPTTDGFTFTLDQLAQAFKIYNADMRSADKVYTHYNIPAAYALMLSNMESVTRVYYGDLFTDDGQYMATKSPYYDAIDTLLRARIRYASGGQAMDLKYFEKDASMKNHKESILNTTGVLTSVRYGQDVMSADDMTGGKYAKTSGMVTLVSNNPELKLAKGQTIRVNVGKIHAGQSYRPLLLTTKNGLQKYLNDSDTKLVKVADKDGYLTFTADEIQGYKQVEVNGYLAVWVPVGAKADQDIRVAPSTKAYSATDKSYQATAALESQLIYEGFSNFQDFVKTDSQYTNKKIAENVNLFKAWGVTSFEMAPQYVSATDGTFLDSIIQNGYAFSDRYDLAMSKNNKYGSKEDLAQALKSLHKAGIQAIVDWVPDQLYQLPGKEVVTATRVDNYGMSKPDQNMKNKLYVANTKSSGSDYQAKYGGEFLKELQAKYPELFTAKMLSTGKVIDPSTKLKTWEAKYFNGTNVLGRGTDYVLKDVASGQYFHVDINGNFLPAALKGDKEAKTGFYYDGKGMTYYSTSGQKAVKSFVSEAGHLYYFNYKGYMSNSGRITVNSQTYYALPNGILLQDTIYTDEQGKSYYFGKTGMMYKGGKWFESKDADGKSRYRYFDKTGVMAVGFVDIDGNTQYYDANGYQVKGQFITNDKGQTFYFDKESGNMAKNKFVQDKDDSETWYYFGQDGAMVKGQAKVGDQTLYFDTKTGKQVKGQFMTDQAGNLSYYAADSGDLQVARFFTTGKNAWYYADSQGHIVKGEQKIKGQTLYFDTKTGKQVKGGFVSDKKGLRYYDADSGSLVTNSFIESAAGSNEWYYMGADGYAVKGNQVIKTKHLYFDENGKQAKGIIVAGKDGRKYFYDSATGARVANRFVEVAGKWYYFGADGAAVTGDQTINGKKMYFRADGSQVKGDAVQDSKGNYRYFNEKTGAQDFNRFVQDSEGYWYSINADGIASSRQMIF